MNLALTSHHALLPALGLQLLLHLPQLGLQGGDGGLEFGAALALDLLQLGLQLSVLPLQLLPGSLLALSGGPLRSQLRTQLLHLQAAGGKNVKKQKQKNTLVFTKYKMSGPFIFHHHHSGDAASLQPLTAAGQVLKSCEVNCGRSKAAALM